MVNLRSNGMLVPAGFCVTLMLLGGVVRWVAEGETTTTQGVTMDVQSSVRLPKPTMTGPISLEQALQQRRSIREYKRDEPLTLEEVSQLLWAAQGVTSGDGFRTSPSAGALFPLELYIVAGNVRNLQAGVYHYRPHGHELRCTALGDKRNELCRASLDQEQVREAPAVIVFSAVYERTTQKYRERGKRYVHFEVGHASQNVHLQAVSLGLGTVPLGAFSDDAVRKVMNLKNDEEPLYLMPVGRK